MTTVQNEPDPTKAVSYQGIHGLSNQVDLSKTCLPISGIGKAFTEKFELSKIVPKHEGARECVHDLLIVHDALSAFFVLYMEARDEYNARESGDAPYDLRKVNDSKKEVVAGIEGMSKKLINDYLLRPALADQAGLLSNAFIGCEEVRTILNWGERIGIFGRAANRVSNSNPAIIGGCLARLELAINSLLKPEGRP